MKHLYSSVNQTAGITINLPLNKISKKMDLIFDGIIGFDLYAEDPVSTMEPLPMKKRNRV